MYCNVKALSVRALCIDCKSLSGLDQLERLSLDGAVRNLKELGNLPKLEYLCLNSEVVTSQSAELRGVISVHGFFSPPGNIKEHRIKASVLALHGHDDPMVAMDTAVAFGQEMTGAGVDWQLHVFGRTKHAFTNPHANDQGRGTVYNEDANRRSWPLIDSFLTEVLE